MLNDSQQRKIETLKQDFGLSSYEALHILVEMEKADALKTLSTVMMGNAFSGAVGNMFQKDFSQVGENFSSLFGNLFQKYTKYKDSDKKNDRDTEE